MLEGPAARPPQVQAERETRSRVEKPQAYEPERMVIRQLRAGGQHLAVIADRGKQFQYLLSLD